MKLRDYCALSMLSCHGESSLAHSFAVGQDRLQTGTSKADDCSSHSWYVQGIARKRRTTAEVGAPKGHRAFPTGPEIQACLSEVQQLSINC